MLLMLVMLLMMLLMLLNRMGIWGCGGDPWHHGIGEEKIKMEKMEKLKHCLLETATQCHTVPSMQAILLPHEVDSQLL